MSIIPYTNVKSYHLSSLILHRIRDLVRTKLIDLETHLYNYKRLAIYGDILYDYKLLAINVGY